LHYHKCPELLMSMRMKPFAESIKLSPFGSIHVPPLGKLLIEGKLESEGCIRISVWDPLCKRLI